MKCHIGPTHNSLVAYTGVVVSHPIALSNRKTKARRLLRETLLDALGTSMYVGGPRI